MRIAIGYINALVPNTICDGYGRKNHINQKTNMTMTNSMNPYSFHSTGCTPTAYFVVEVGFREREYSVNICKLQRFQIVLHFICVELWHEDTTDALFGFGRSDNIFPPLSVGMTL